MGPALLRAIVQSRLGEVWYLPWADIARITEEAVELSSARTELRPLAELARY